MAKQKSHKKLRLLGGLVGIILILAGGYIAYISFTTKDQSAPIAGQPRFAKQTVDPAKKTVTQKQAYSVPPSHPRELIIDKLGVDANILSMGLLGDTSLDAPKTAWDVGWYNKSALPGTDSGALLIDGHVNDALNQPGVFYKIATLSIGDEMKIQRGDNQVFTYRVVRVDQTPLEKVDMTTMARSINPSKEGLNLITCGGIYDEARQTYDDRVLVYAERTS